MNPTAPVVIVNGSAVTASGWQLETAVSNGSFVNQTMPYTVAFADNGKKIRYYATNGCGTTNGNAVTVTVNPNLPASVTIAASTATTICAGTSVTFTASPINGGAPTYQWYKGGTPISGETAATYTTSTLANGDAVP